MTVYPTESFRKRSTRASTRLSEVVPPRMLNTTWNVKATLFTPFILAEEEEAPSEHEPTPDDAEVPEVAVGPSASTSQSGSTSDDPTSGSQGVDSRPGARRVRLRLSKSNKLPATPGAFGALTTVPIDNIPNSGR
jgi:hypothetical protein